MTFDPTKPVQTRDGRPVLILSTDRNGLAFGDSIVAVLGDRVRIFQADGRFVAGAQSSDDLVNVPEETVEFRNVGLGDLEGAKPQGIGCRVLNVGCAGHGSPEEARRYRNPDPFTTPFTNVVKITTVDGKLTGLELVA